MPLLKSQSDNFRKTTTICNCKRILDNGERMRTTTHAMGTRPFFVLFFLFPPSRLWTRLEWSGRIGLDVRFWLMTS